MPEEPIFKSKKMPFLYYTTLLGLVIVIGFAIFLPLSSISGGNAFQWEYLVISLVFWVALFQIFLLWVDWENWKKCPSFRNRTTLGKGWYRIYGGGFVACMIGAELGNLYVSGTEAFLAFHAAVLPIFLGAIVLFLFFYLSDKYVYKPSSRRMRRIWVLINFIFLTATVVVAELSIRGFVPYSLGDYLFDEAFLATYSTPILVAWVLVDLGAIAYGMVRSRRQGRLMLGRTEHKIEIMSKIKEDS